MKNMNPVSGTYPNEYTRNYVSQFIEAQNPDEIDMITGASNSGGNFAKLAAAVVEQAKAGDSEVKIVQSEPEE